MKGSKTLFIIFVLLVLGGLFYWFQYRPSEIRKKCVVIAQEKSFSGGFDIVTERSMERASKAYNDCIVGEGLAPERLYNP